MNIQLIALDLDGTTLNSSGHISEFTKETLEKAIRQGIQVVIASGRAGSALPQDVLAIHGLNYAITSNGSSIFALPDFKRIFACDMTPETVDAVLSVASGCGFTYEAFIAGRAYTARAYFDHPTDFCVPERMNAYVRTTRTPVPSMEDFIRSHRHEIEGIDFIIPDAIKKEKIRHQLTLIPDLYITSSESYYLELAAGSVSKASALHALASRLQIAPSQIIAFGDGGNDIELLSYAGCGVAMGNAAAILKDAADDITLSNNEDGVAFYLRKILKFC